MQVRPQLCRWWQNERTNEDHEVCCCQPACLPSIARSLADPCATAALPAAELAFSPLSRLALRVAEKDVSRPTRVSRDGMKIKGQGHFPTRPRSTIDLHHHWPVPVNHFILSGLRQGEGQTSVPHAQTRSVKRVGGWPLLYGGNVFQKTLTLLESNYPARNVFSPVLLLTLATLPTVQTTVLTAGFRRLIGFLNSLRPCTKGTLIDCKYPETGLTADD